MNIIFEYDLDQRYKNIESMGDWKQKGQESTDLAEDYLKKGCLEKAFNIFTKPWVGSAAKIRGVREFFWLGEKEKACQILDKIEDNIQVIIIAQEYLSNDEVTLITIIKKISSSAFYCQLVKTGLAKQHDISKVNCNVIDAFYNKLAQDCFRNVKLGFSQIRAQVILQEIQRKATEEATIRAFMRLKK